MEEKPIMGTFGYDESFLQTHYKNSFTLTAGSSKIIVVPELQARVMTSSLEGNTGESFGWINYDYIKAGTYDPHINPVGGEERFWMGPEGGQYSIFFEKDAEFTLDNWFTPKIIDSITFDLDFKSEQKAIFTKDATLTNYSGTQFTINIERIIEVLDPQVIFKNLKLEFDNKVSVVGYTTHNKLTNLGEEAWTKEGGLLSIWMLGMLNHSPNTTVILPFNEGDSTQLGTPVNDAYFGKVPSDRLIIKNGVAFFKADGKYRSKVGLNPKRAKNVMGSFDSKNNTLTIVTYNKPENELDYVNSMWEIQKEPYKGDVVNSYNDGEPAPGEKPLGPFYELESSSPAKELAPSETLVHMQQTYHFGGSTDHLNIISEQILGVSLKDIPFN